MIVLEDLMPQEYDILQLAYDREFFLETVKLSPSSRGFYQAEFENVVDRWRAMWLIRTHVRASPT